jgi:hypothetical protein
LCRIKEKLRKQYAESANQFTQALDAISNQMTNLEGDLDKQLEKVRELIKKFEALNNKLATVEALAAQCAQANIEDNEYTIYSVEDLQFEHGIVEDSLSKKELFIENQIVSRTITNVTPEQLESYTEVREIIKRRSRNILDV